MAFAVHRGRCDARAVAHVLRVLAAAICVAILAMPCRASNGVCPLAVDANGPPPIYLPVGPGGLMRLELSPAVPGGMGTLAVTREEVAALCAEGFDVRPLDTQLLPDAMSIVRRGARVYGNLWLQAKTPSGAGTQWLRFDIGPIGYFGEGEHVAIALFADAAAFTATPPAIIGNGIVIGEVNFAPNGCGSIAFPAAPAHNSEVEAFWRGGNSLWGESCGDVDLANGGSYRFLVASDAEGVVRYENDTGRGRVVAPAPIVTSTRRPAFEPANAGILIASTNFCSTCHDFEIRLTRASSGWSTLRIDDPRLAASPALVPDARSIAFAAQTVDARGAPQPIVFTNEGAVDLHPAFAITADWAPHCDVATSPACASELALSRESFVVDATNCAVLPAHRACTLGVAFAPRAAFAMRAKLEFGDQAGGPIRAIALEGFGVPSLAADDTSLVVEYFHAGLGHYFVTPLASEVALLDAGAIAGWQRTGEWFVGFREGRGEAHGASAVCRYYGRPEAGLDSHFYSASPSECDAVAQRFPESWILETAELFDIGLPDPGSGACAQGVPVYRLWNAHGGSNHRYTTDAATRDRMVAAGWVPEGYGPQSVAMCDASR